MITFTKTSQIPECGIFLGLTKDGTIYRKIPVPLIPGSRSRRSGKWVPLDVSNDLMDDALHGRKDLLEAVGELLGI